MALGYELVPPGFETVPPPDPAAAMPEGTDRP